MEGDVMTETSEKLPEPPKFNLDDLPEPPKLEPIGMEFPEMHKREISNPLDSNLHNEAAIPPPPESMTESPEMPEPPKKEEKKGFLSKIFGKKKEEPKEKVEKTPISEPAEKVDLKPLSEDQFAPPGADFSTSDEAAQTMQDLPPPPSLEEPSSIAQKPDATPLDESPITNKLDEMPPPPSLDAQATKPPMPKKADAIPSADNVPPPPVKAEAKPDGQLPPKNMARPEKKIAPPPLGNLGPLPKIEKKKVELGQSKPDWEVEAEDYIESEKEVKEVKKEIEKFKPTPLTKVKGVGPARAKKLKKAGIKSAEHVAKHDYKKLAEKAKIPETHAKKIVTHAKKIAKLKKNLKKTKSKKQSISDVLKELEKEKASLEALQKKGEIDENKLIEIQSHKDIIQVLEKLQERRTELQEIEDNLSEKQNKLDKHESTYKRDLTYIENLKRKLDHDVRERTQYLINLEKEYFQKAQKLAKKKADLEIRQKEIEEKEEYLKEKEISVKKNANDIEDRAITIETKEKKLEKILQDLNKQDQLLKEKEETLLQTEEDYVKKLEALESHEQSVLKELEERRQRLETREKEVKLKQRQLTRKEKNVDKQSVAVEYAKDILEGQKSKLIDEEFEAYLRDELGTIGASDQAGVTESINLGPKGDSTIYQLIDTCKKLLVKNKVTEAKVFYNQIREKYYDKSFTNNKEKEALHNMIRSLYDEINLADVSSNT